MTTGLLRLTIACGLVTAGFAQHPVVPAFERFHLQGGIAPAMAGRLLLGELNCTRCHAHPDIPPRQAPKLDGVGARLQAEWLRAFLMNPRRAQPGATMPDVVDGPDRVEKVDALTHFLASRKRGWKAPPLEKHSAPHTGGRLFGRIGCAACHSDPLMPDPEADQRADGLVSLRHVKAKYSHAALADFLNSPLKHRPGGRMPDMQLGMREAADIAAYLLDTLDIVENGGRATLVPFAVDPDKAMAGREVFAASGCASCHSLGDIESAFDAPELRALAGKPGMCPKTGYALSDSQTAALTSVLAAPIADLEASQKVDFTMLSMNCHACHARDGVGGPARARWAFFSGDEALGNEGRFPPPLSGVGRKLQPEWIKSVLLGEGVMRRYMRTRMPVFGFENVGHLARDFGIADGDSDHPAFGDGDSGAGRLLMGTEGGVGCITCHGLADRQGLAMRALSLTGATRRYQPGWFKRNLIHPLETRPGTLMPSFWPGGVAGNQSILMGDTDRQIAAIWRYLDEDNTEPPPGYPDFEKRDFEIIPVDRPIVQRTTIAGVGTHAIAVGFPERVHFAFDAEKCRLAIVWRGRFIDGYNSWFSRMKPSAAPLGGNVHALADDGDDGGGRLRFKGYTLDQSGVPTFLYTDGATAITDRIEPDGNGGFKRTVARGAEITITTIDWQ